jgi:hypothetical protein
MNERETTFDPEKFLLAFDEMLSELWRDNADARLHVADMLLMNQLVLRSIGYLKAECHARADELGMERSKIGAIRDLFLHMDPGQGFANITEWKHAMESLLLDPKDIDTTK